MLWSVYSLATPHLASQNNKKRQLGKLLLAHVAWTVMWRLGCPSRLLMNDGPIMALGLLNILQLLLFHKTYQPNTIDIFGFEKFNSKVKNY